MLPWGEGKVVKLFHPRWAFSAETELARARAVHALGAPCPEPFELVEHEGRTGIVYERVDGPLLRDVREGLPRMARRLAELNVAIHARRVPAGSTLPRFSEVVAAWIGRFPERERARAVEELARLPDDAGLCHLDLHPGNVIVRAGELVVVDWINAAAGSLAWDAARSIVLIAWQGAERRDGARQAARLALVEHYRRAIAPHVGEAELRCALGFAADAILRQEPNNPFAAELQSCVPWR